MPYYALFFMLFTMASVGLPGTSDFVGEFLALAGIYQVNSWVTAVCATGIILGAAYMLYLYWRVAFGVQKNADAAAMPDLVRANAVMLLPIAARGAVDGRLSGELPRPDAQRHRRARSARIARRADRVSALARRHRCTSGGERDRPSARPRPRGSRSHARRARGSPLMDARRLAQPDLPRDCC